MNSYPWYTTNPKPPKQVIEEIPSDGILDQVIYPDLDELNANVDQELLRPFFDRSKKPLKRSLHDSEYGSEESIGKLSVKPDVDRAKKVSVTGDVLDHCTA